MLRKHEGGEAPEPPARRGVIKRTAFAARASSSRQVPVVRGRAGSRWRSRCARALANSRRRSLFGGRTAGRSRPPQRQGGLVRRVGCFRPQHAGRHRAADPRGRAVLAGRQIVDAQTATPPSRRKQQLRPPPRHFLPTETICAATLPLPPPLPSSATETQLACLNSVVSL